MQKHAWSFSGPKANKESNCGNMADQKKKCKTTQSKTLKEKLHVNDKVIICWQTVALLVNCDYV